MSNLLVAETAQIIVEAETAEEALAEIHETLGPQAKIVDAQRVRRGGIGGFFSREVIELTAEAPRIASVGDALAQMVASVEEPIFSRILEREMTTTAEPLLPRIPEAPASRFATASGLAVNETTGVSAAADQRQGAVKWSAERMRKVGIPHSIVAAVGDLDPSDDLAWVSAIARAVQGLCRGVPAGDAALVGARADRLCEGLGLGWYGAPQETPEAGSVGLLADGSDIAWLDAAIGGRWLHLVTDDADLGWLPAGRQPLVVSWTRKRGVGAALTIAQKEGASLGYAVGANGYPVAATPVDVAMAIRALMERA
jgi:hypothetical protein